MIAAQLLAELQSLGVKLEAHVDRLRFYPRDAVGPELLVRLREHKDDILAVLRGTVAGSVGDDWREVCDDQGWASLVQADCMDRAVMASDSVPTCQVCHRQDAWQDIGGGWHCSRCDPPTTARRLRERAAWLRRSG